MRYLCLFLALCCVALLMAAPGLADKQSRLSEITLTSPNGQHTITLKATDDGCTIQMRNTATLSSMGPTGITMLTNADHADAGIWLVNGKTGRTVSMLAGNSMYAGGFQMFDSAASIRKGTGCEVALSADAKGGYLQLCRGKEVSIFGRDDLLPPKGLKLTAAECLCTLGGPCTCTACQCAK